VESAWSLRVDHKSSRAVANLTFMDVVADVFNPSSFVTCFDATLHWMWAAHAAGRPLPAARQGGVCCSRGAGAPYSSLHLASAAVLHVIPSLAALNVSAVSLEDVSAAMLLHHPRLEPGSVYRGLVAACRSLKIGFQRMVRVGTYTAGWGATAARRLITGALRGDATRALYLQATQILGGDVGAQPDDAPARNQRLRAAR